MFWLMGFMWLYLLFFFILGMLVRGFLTPRVMTPAGEDIAAELATVRTRLQETEADRARMKARVAELNSRLEEARKEVVSAEAKVHEAVEERDRLRKLEPEAAAAVELRDRVARLEGELEAYRGRKAEPVAPAPAEPTPEAKPKSKPEVAERTPEPKTKPKPEVAEAERPQPASELDLGEPVSETRIVAQEPEPEPKPEPESELEPKPEPDISAAPASSPDPKPYAANGSAFLPAPDDGEPDDLTKIKGIGAKLQKTLNDLGVFYYSQIAGWTDSQVAEVDAHMAFPGRILRDDWRTQARGLAQSETRPPPPL